MPSNKGNEPPYFRPTEQRKDSDGKGQRIENSGRCRRNLPPVALSQFEPMARFLHLHCNSCRIAAAAQFAKLLDLVSNAEIVEFGETRAMRYRNWGVGCTEE